MGEFLAAARKTRDLWYGSGLFTDVARAVAKAVADAVGGHRHLIFPAPAAPSDLINSSFAVADEIWVEVPATVPEKDLPGIALRAKEAGHKAWLAAAAAASRGVSQFLTPQFTAQLLTPNPFADYAGDVIECYAAWSPVTAGGYAACRKRVKRLLDGRTRCRNFPQARGDDAGLLKSSLDGARPTVLDATKTARDAVRRRLRLTQGEQLDATGLVKRLGKEQAYPSVARIAADPWLRGAKVKEPELFAAFVTACHQFSKNYDLKLLSPADYKQFAEFPFDGALVYETRHAEFAEELADYPDNDIAARRQAVGRFVAGPMKPVRDALAALVRTLGEPQPYYAVLAADGDGVGVALNKVETAETHRQFSTRLAEFASDVPKIVAEYFGAVVYAGGDDVLAFVPLDKMVVCGARLNERFHKVWTESPVSLSVGFAVSHFMDALEDAVHSAHAALNEDAKGFAGKNALAVRFQPRGGAPLHVVGGWGEFPARLGAYADAFNDESLPSKAAYDIRRLGEQYGDGNVWASGEETGAAIRADARRLLKRKGGDAGAILGPLLDGVRDGNELVARSEQVLVARRLADANRQAGGT